MVFALFNSECLSKKMVKLDHSLQIILNADLVDQT